ncbi:PLA2G4 [Mytilus coruscus]|uniref:PLA2G4 n=1 Tax=Mytilus coruscus TaxID=42192 RepID=A0A6J8E2V6_MYTCO|nr:PLA2G4 [Mytilus coruscus]
MAQRSFSTSTCQAESSQRRPLTLKLSNCKQKSEDDYHAHSKPYSDESDRLRRVQSFKYNRKSSRRSKVMYRVRGKSMIKVKLSPTSPEDIIFKKNMKEVERVPVLDLLDIDKAKRIECKTVPNIALMGSGGGYRAMVAMSGIINSLYNTKILDCILYTAVLSGSSWFIATLYSHPEWPNIDPKYIQKQLKTDISKNPKNLSQILWYGWDFFCKKWEGKSWNFTTDVFGPMLGGVLIPNRLNCKWSEQQDKLAEGIVPLPLLSAIHAKDEQNTKTFHGICGSAFTLTHEELANKALFENYLKNDIEKLCLIDAGLAFNSPYPLLFQPGRDVDLILSFDFTDRKKDSNDPFKTLLTAEDWARNHEIKFPKINVDKYKGKTVQELYIFEDENDPECPIIMHFVLVNKDFRTYKKPDKSTNPVDIRLP